MPTAIVKYVDPTPLAPIKGHPERHWSKVEGPFQSFGLLERERVIENIAGRESEYGIDDYGFAVHHWPVDEQCFANECSIRESYYAEVERVLRAKLDNVKQVFIFDHTLRQMKKDSARKPVMQVHVDQTLRAAEARVKRHMPAVDSERLLNSRYSLINVWRPIGNPAIEYPLAVVDWRTTSPEDYVEVDLLYPVRDREATTDDDRGLEVIPGETSLTSVEGYEVRGETYGVAPNERHKFYYVKNMSPDSTFFIKCSDSQGPGLPDGVNKTASCCPHTAFVDPETPKDAPSRRSIEVRCLVFFGQQGLMAEQQQLGP